MHLGVIGYGAIGRGLLETLARIGHAPDRVTLLLRPGRTAVPPGPGDVVHRLDALQDAAPDLVVEAAGHAAVAGFVPELLARGITCVIASVGALADPGIETAIRAAPGRGAQALIPAGAIGGIDMAASLPAARAVYEGRKPPLAWAGSPAEARFALAELTEATVVFEGSARQAARAFPKNANVAATLALATGGFDQTRVKLIADPRATGNSHAFAIESPDAHLRFEVTATPSAANPKSSQTVILSLARAVANRTAGFAI